MDRAIVLEKQYVLRMGSPLVMHLPPPLRRAMTSTTTAMARRTKPGQASVATEIHVLTITALAASVNTRSWVACATTRISVLKQIVARTVSARARPKSATTLTLAPWTPVYPRAAARLLPMMSRCAATATPARPGTLVRGALACRVPPPFVTTKMAARRTVATPR